MEHADIVVVGGGLAGAVTVESYRKAGGDGSVVLLTQEPTRPVHRPPLSKEYLRGDETLDKVYVHPETFYQDNNIDLRLGARVVAIDCASRTVKLEDGSAIEYGTLVLATGARPRKLKLPGGDLAGTFYLRSLGSSEKLRDAYGAADKAVILGAGFIGIEVASTMTQKGVQCTVVEMGPRMWPALVPPDAAEAIQRYCESKGVSFRFNASVESIEGNERVESVRLSTGETVPADLVVIGAGAILNTELAEQAGLAVDRGVVVDDYLRTSDPHIYAAGDIARFPDPVGGSLHLEHWDNALNQGRALGKTLAGEPTRFEHVAYFFSDIFDLGINMIGYPSSQDETVTNGDLHKPTFTTVYGKDGKVVAALMVNDDAEFDAWTQRVKEGAPFAQAVAT